ncbi:hypothetical protein H2O73_04210 [Vibrio sp. 404]|uniref:Uncharacterized protein n=1 Tax=Vibrio marinisediminis TaxID=2758441 RepID=A0A7W2ISI1_9VIBR|nr:hypothetical protein [Vibrio marinisediminis]MBA5761541.1 hypothetical protein [Vibrio marinisediminis]
MIRFKHSLSVLAIGFVSYAHAYGDTASIEKCSALLPEGAQYDIAIQLSVDKTTQTAQFDRTLEIASNANNEQQPNVDPFIQCVSLLIGKAEKPLSEEEEKAALTPLLKGMVYN